MIWTGDGTNHLAKSLVTLYAQVNKLAPNRDTHGGPDGTLGDARHQATKSDHNPDENHRVCALDITHDPVNFNSHKFAEFLISKRDPRLQYVISNGRIANCDPIGGAAPGTWRPYHGVNPHDKHIHISVRHTASADDPKDWDVTGWTNTVVTKQAMVNLPRLHFGSTNVEVNTVRTKLGLLACTAPFDAALEKELVYFQFKHGLEIDGWVGPMTWSSLGVAAEVQGASKHVNSKIIATEFGGAKDRNTSAYDQSHVISDTEIGASLPFRFATVPRPLLWIKGPNGVKVENVPLVDVGPIYPHPARGPADPYWETGSRPRAETQKVLSQAGIDLTPALAKKLGINGKAPVDWGFMGAQEIEVQNENPPSYNEPGAQPPQPTDPTKPLPAPDWTPLFATLATTLLPWVQAKLENKPTPQLKLDLGQLMTIGAPLILNLLNQKQGTNLLPAILAGVQGAAKSEPVMSSLDKLLGGEALLGKKTAIGAIGTLISIGLQFAGVIDPITMGGTTSILSTLMPLGLSILGLIAKMDRKAGTGGAG